MDVWKVKNNDWALIENSRMTVEAVSNNTVLQLYIFKREFETQELNEEGKKKTEKTAKLKKSAACDVTKTQLTSFYVSR